MGISIRAKAGYAVCGAEEVKNPWNNQTPCMFVRTHKTFIKTSKLVFILIEAIDHRKLANYLQLKSSIASGLGIIKELDSDTKTQTATYINIHSDGKIYFDYAFKERGTITLNLYVYGYVKVEVLTQVSACDARGQSQRPLLRYWDLGIELRFS